MAVKENLNFLLRSATLTAPFRYASLQLARPYGQANRAITSAILYPEDLLARSGTGTNYEYYGFRTFSPSLGYSVLQPFRPAQENALWRNFVYNPADIDANGYWTTGTAYNSAWPNLRLLPYPQYALSGWTGTPLPMLLTSNTSAYPWGLWIYQPDVWSVAELGLTTNANYDISLPSGTRNLFGLTLSSVLGHSDGVLDTFTLQAGGASNPWPPYSCDYFPNTASPILQTADYYFASETPHFLYGAPLPPVPGSPVFRITNSSPLLIAPFGEPISIAGWAKQAITNGYPGKFAYLEQYFDRAYKIDAAGVVTTNQTGLLSPYGEFLPTEPGPIALITMPDIETGQCGTGTLHVIKLQLDANHDGTMDLTLGGPDNTAPERPFLFWINNDRDFARTTFIFGEPLEPGHEIGGSTIYRDCDYPRIQSERDLEDFARLWICGIPPLPAAGAFQVTLSLSATAGTPAVNLVHSIESSGDILYLTDTNISRQQATGEDSASANYKFAHITPTQPYTFPSAIFTNIGKKSLLFEAAGIGQAQLILTIKSSGNTIAEARAWLDLRNVSDLYERAVTTNTYAGAITNWGSVIQRVETALLPDVYGTPDVIVYIHGAANKTNSWLQRSDTIFKRLYWARYQGKFASIRWDSMMIADPSWFNLSELYAYKASFALNTYLSQLRTRLPDHRLHLFAHSQGGAVASEALSSGAPFDTLILSQVAMPASCYDPNAPTNSDLLYRENNVARTPDWQPMGYHGAHTNIAGRAVNYFNINDGLLDWWLTDQKSFKPTQFYAYDTTNCWFYFDPENNGRRLLTDPQESRAQLARSRTLAIGAQGPPPGQTGQGVIQSAFNLRNQLGIGDSQDEHSAFFARPIQSVLPFYLQILDSIQP